MTTLRKFWRCLTYASIGGAATAAVGCGIWWLTVTFGPPVLVIAFFAIMASFIGFAVAAEEG